MLKGHQAINYAIYISGHTLPWTEWLYTDVEIFWFSFWCVYGFVPTMESPMLNSRSHFSDIFYQMYTGISTQVGKMVYNLSNLFNLSVRKETQTLLFSLIFFLHRWEYHLGQGSYLPVLHSLWSAESGFNSYIISKLPSRCDIPLICVIWLKYLTEGWIILMIHESELRRYHGKQDLNPEESQQYFHWKNSF